MVGNAAVGQNLAFQVLQQRAKIADGPRAATQPRKTFGHCGQQRLGIRGAVKQRENSEDLLRLQGCAFYPQFVDEALGIRQAVEVHANGRTARSRLRARRQAQILHRFGRFRQKPTL